MSQYLTDARAIALDILGSNPYKQDLLEYIKEAEKVPASIDNMPPYLYSTFDRAVSEVHNCVQLDKSAIAEIEEKYKKDWSDIYDADKGIVAVMALQNAVRNEIRHFLRELDQAIDGEGWLDSGEEIDPEDLEMTYSDVIQDIKEEENV